MAPDPRLHHPQVQAVLESEAAFVLAAETLSDPAAERAAYVRSTERLGGPPEPVAVVEALTVPSVGVDLPAALYVPAEASAPAGLLVWLHGGGWYVGDIPTFDRVARSLANISGLKVLLVEYRLAPEHRWPAQVHDADAALRWVRSREGAARLGVDPTRVAVGGDSSGGQLAAVAARHARHDGLAPLRGQLLVYPALDAHLGGPSADEFADGPVLTRAAMEHYWALYLDGADRDDPDASPLAAADREGLPPTWIAVAASDPLRDDGLRYAAALDAAGVAVSARTFDGMVHGFLRWAGAVDGSRELLTWLGAAARDAAAR